MNDSVKRTCDLISFNSQIASKAYKWNNNSSHAVFGASYNEKEADLDRLKEISILIEKNNRFFSSLRNNYVRIALAAELMKCNDPVSTLENIKETNDILSARFHSDHYVALASLIVYSLGKDPQLIAEKMDQIYSFLNSKHWFISSKNNLSALVFMAASPKSADELISESESIYNNISSNFKFSKDDALSISLILAIFEDPMEWKCKGLVQIMKDLKESKIKYSSYKAASMLAPLAMLSIYKDNRSLVSEIKEASQYLSTLKVTGGFFGVNSNSRNMLAAIAVIKDLGDSELILLSEKITLVSLIYASIEEDDSSSYTV